MGLTPIRVPSTEALSIFHTDFFKNLNVTQNDDSTFINHAIKKYQSLNHEPSEQFNLQSFEQIVNNSHTCPQNIFFYSITIT